MKAEHTVTDPGKKARQVPAGQLQREGRAHARRLVCRSASAPDKLGGLTGRCGEESIPNEDGPSLPSFQILQTKKA